MSPNNGILFNDVSPKLLNKTFDLKLLKILMLILF